MGIVKVKFIGSIHDVVKSGKKEIELSDDASVQDLLTELFARHGQEFERRIVSPSGKLLAHTRMFVNGEEMDDSKMGFLLYGEGNTSANVEFFVIQQSMGGS